MVLITHFGCVRTLCLQIAINSTGFLREERTLDAGSRQHVDDGHEVHRL